MVRVMVRVRVRLYKRIDRIKEWKIKRQTFTVGCADTYSICWYTECVGHFRE